MSQEAEGKNYTVESQPVQKTPTRIEGLDDVLHGGLPTGRLTIIKGGPGAGKTVFGLELLVRGTESGQPAVFISFEETRESIRRNALAMGWDLAKIEEAGKLALINPEIDFEAVSSGKFNIEGLCAILEGQARRLGAKLIIIDAIDILMRMFDDPSRARNQLVTLHRWLSGQDLTAVMTVKATEQNSQDYSHLDFMADCVINLDQRIRDQITIRRLHVIKYRGSGYASREHPFIITKQGVVVMPLSFVNLVQQSTGEFVSTGDDKLNAVLGGGFRRGSSILISGASGSGKTTLAVTLAVAAAQLGERVLYVSFEQSELALNSEMKSVGFDLKSLSDEGNLRIKSVMPESLVMEEHLYNIEREIEKYKPDHIILDAVSATHRIGSSQAAMEFLIYLTYIAKKREITCIYTNQTFAPIDKDIDISGLGISSLLDTAIILNYFREDNSIGRNLLVLKSRGTKHSQKYHQFRISDNGILIVNNAKE